VVVVVEEEEEEEGRKEGAVEEIERKEATRIVWRAACLAAYIVRRCVVSCLSLIE